MAPDERPPRLQPPPRVSAPADGPTQGSHGRGDNRSTRVQKTGFAVLFGTLVLALIGVFVVLPRWAANRPPTAGPLTPVASDVTSSPATTVPQFAPETATTRPEALPAALPRPTPSPPPRPRENPRPVSPPSAAPNKAAFVAAMSRGLQALERGEWDAAREAFETASSLRPGAPEVTDGLARAAAAERRALVSAGTRRGLELEASENWAEAEKVYLQVLTVDPEAAGALDGRDRAAERAALDKRLQYHIRNSGRLASLKVFEDAAELLAEAREITPRGPRLQDQLSRLEQSLNVASTPVPVIVVSDNLTNVVIYRVDRLGVFSRRELSLRPGIYTAVGSRIGFRDVRVQFTVTSGAALKPVTVVCTEEL
ncbi:MAG: hypothetical protein QNL88_00485 [Acidobacteriota bacterium]|nr:hypothetical protein [Acidobacteriota bacterium]